MAIESDLREHRLRLVVSIGGLALVGVTLAANPPSGWVTPAVLEVLLIGGGFFGLSAIHSARIEIRASREED